jgi:hypothetical protein
MDTQGAFQILVHQDGEGGKSIALRSWRFECKHACGLTRGIQAVQAFQERVMTSVAALLNNGRTVKKEELVLEPSVRTALCRNRETAVCSRASTVALDVQLNETARLMNLRSCVGMPAHNTFKGSPGYATIALVSGGGMKTGKGAHQ